MDDLNRRDLRRLGGTLLADRWKSTPPLDIIHT
jgi:hypothetical protein